MALRQVAVWGFTRPPACSSLIFWEDSWKAIMFVTTVYYSESIQTQTSEGKKRLGRVQGRISRCPLLVEPGVSAASWERAVCVEHCQPEMLT